MKRVYQTGKQWEFHEDGVPENIEWVAFDDIKFIPITDRVHAQLCIPSHNGKFGIYTLDTCKFFGGPGKYCNPTKEALPYDEILLSNRIDGICFAAFRIGDKWGIEKIVDVDYVNPAEDFPYTYGLTKRMIFVPCEHDTLESAQLQIINWGDITTF